MASRWLLRLENLLLGLGAEGAAALAAAQGARRGLLAQARAARPRRRRACRRRRRPSPRPPAAARPAELSVTQIETLVRDPYAIYAQQGARPEARSTRPGARPTRWPAAARSTRRSTRFVARDRRRPARRTPTRSSAAARARGARRGGALAGGAGDLDGAAGARSPAGSSPARPSGGPAARPAAREVRGRRALDGLALPFAVTAKADRIDRAPDGGYAIYDYKSGGVPSASRGARPSTCSCRSRRAIAAAGGFEGLAGGARRRTSSCSASAAGEALPLRRRPGRAWRETWARLRALIAHYQDPSDGFTARLRPQRLSYASDYDHLSRNGEWADGDAAARRRVVTRRGGGAGRGRRRRRRRAGSRPTPARARPGC